MTSSEHASPQRGDIIVERRYASAPTYVVGVFQCTPQLVYQKREEAIQSATAFAAARRVRAWYTDDGQTYQCIGGS